MRPVENLEDVPGELSSPRVILMWVPHGKPVDQNLEQVLPSLEAGDVVADCGNSFWEDSQQRHDRVAERGVHFLDIGTSGCISDLPGWNGAAFMVGGPERGLRRRRAAAGRHGRRRAGGGPRGSVAVRALG